MKCILPISVVLVTALASQPLHAESATQDLTEIVVTAKASQSLEDILGTAHVLNIDAIERLQAQDLPDLLNTLSGVSARDSGGRGSVTDVFIRGASNSQIIVLIDGVRVGSATLGSAALNAYPVEAIERIEVVKGPIAGIYGADAVGGVIQLFTQKGRGDKSSLSATLGSDNLTELSAGFAHETDTLSYALNASIEETDGIDRTSIQTGGNDDRDGFKESAVSLGVNYTPSESTQVNLSVLYSDNTAKFDNLFGADVGDESDTQTLSTALQVKHQLSEALKWSSVLGLNQDKIDTLSSFPSSFETDRDSVGTELYATLNDQHALTFGVDYYDETIRSSTSYPITTRDNKGVFALLKSDFDRLSWLASVRYDDNSAYGSDTNTSLAINFDINQALRLVLSAGTAFVAPSFNFLYFPFFGNPELKPEESESIELSLMGDLKGGSWRVSAFQTKVTNLFSFDPATFLAANVGQAELKGIELDAQWAWQDWLFAGSVDLLDATNTATQVELDDRAQQTLKLSAQRPLGDLSLRFGLYGERKRFDLNGQALASFVLFDAGIEYPVNENLDVLASIDNLFDKDHTVNLISQEQRFLTQGRQAKLTLRYRF